MAGAQGLLSFLCTLGMGRGGVISGVPADRTGSSGPGGPQGRLFPGPPGLMPRTSARGEGLGRPDANQPRAH